MRSGVRDLGTLANGIDSSSAACVEVLLGMVTKSEDQLRQSTLQTYSGGAAASVSVPLTRQPSHGSKAKGELISLRQRLNMEDFKKVLETILKVLGNIRREPGALKFRTLKKDNALVVSTFLANQEAIDILFSAGFEMKDSTIELQLVDLDRISRVITVVQEALSEAIAEWNDMY